MEQPTLPGIPPVARIELEVLLGPAPDIDAIYVTVHGADGRLMAMRCWPGSIQRTASKDLETAWRALLNAIPYAALARQERHTTATQRQDDRR